MNASYVTKEVSITLSMVGFQVYKPGRRIKAGRREETSTNSYSTWVMNELAGTGCGERRYLPGFDLSAAEMTASFSTGFMEHVEYTIRPSGLSIFIARCKILSWSL